MIKPDNRRSPKKMFVRAARFCLFLILLESIDSKELIWRVDADVSNPDNWIGGKLAPNCKGLHFSPDNSAPVYITKLVTPELTLPSDGVLKIVDGGFIELKDNKKCIKLKPFRYSSWYDPSAWRGPSNVAIPDKEKIPCDFDDVTFPKEFHTRISNSFGSTKLGAVKMGTSTISKRRLIFFLVSKPGADIFYETSGTVGFFFSEKEKCEDPYGCLCHEEYMSCYSNENENKEEEKRLSCLDPVLPEDFCREICGAYVTFKVGKGPHLEDIRNKLKEYSVDTHASRVKDYMGTEVIQVVFSEKEYTGRSLEEAESFRKYVEGFEVENLQILESGRYYVEGGASGTVGIVLGTLVAVCAFFAILLYLNGDKSTLSGVIQRYRRARGSILSVPFFARFDNTDENLIIDGQSEYGSVQDVAKSFDNPMYGQSDPASTSTSTQHENPLYDVVKEEEEKHVDVDEQE